ncbi:unnamed protein product [Brassica rapa]|uniref:RRM domain-containing protein n=1 Tax=Brassica campestris TaxID=3711 RepID=A0A8D9D2P2_BRACM|nr:unnamed protein product [Brassica rapa]
MDESANKGLESKGTDAEIRKSSIRRISVEGYDTSLRMEDVDDALRKHFASCGNIIHVYVPRNYEETILCRYAFVYVNEEDVEKALRLDGSDMGGQILQIKSYPFHETHLENDLAPMKEVKVYWPQQTLKVTGYDTSLPVEDIQIELEKYFSSHGSFVYQDETASGAIKTKAYIYVQGPDAVDKALELSGRSVEGLNFVVTKVYPLPENPHMSGFIHPINLTRFTREQIEDPNLCFITEGQQKKSDTSEGNQKKKKKKKKKNKKSKTREGIQKKKKSETREGKQKKGVEISL